jgi:glycosyltransferase involved in cell wall biosynthesis
LVPKEDPAALADRLERLIEDEDLRVPMGREGRKLVVDKYNVKRNILRLESLFLDAGRH